MRKRLAGGLLGSLALSVALAGAAVAAPGGNTAGDTLVNVQISNVWVAVPIAVAANLCDINVNILANTLDAGDTACTTTATADSISSPGWNNGGGSNQAGNSLVNVQIANLTILVPVSLAANLCDVKVSVLATAIGTGTATCTATATTLAS